MIFAVNRIPWPAFLQQCAEEEPSFQLEIKLIYTTVAKDFDSILIILGELYEREHHVLEFHIVTHI